jgi:hypothetical protein
MRPAINAYSMAVAPSSSRTNFSINETTTHSLLHAAQPDAVLPHVILAFTLQARVLTKGAQGPQNGAFLQPVTPVLAPSRFGRIAGGMQRA